MPEEHDELNQTGKAPPKGWDYIPGEKGGLAIRLDVIHAIEWNDRALVVLTSGGRFELQTPDALMWFLRIMDKIEGQAEATHGT